MNATLTPAERNQLINKAEALGYKLLIADGYTAAAPLRFYNSDCSDRDSYTAEVYKAYEGPWGVQTTSYGSVSPETVDLVIDGLKRAQELVKLLTDAGL